MKRILIAVLFVILSVPAFAADYGLLVDIFATGYDYNGAPVSGGTVEVYEAGTTTPADIWYDRDKTEPTSKGVSSFELDTQGRKAIYGDGIYKFVIKTAADVTITTLDNVEVRIPTADTGETSNVVTDYGASCDGLADDSAAFQTAINESRKIYVPTGTCIIKNVEIRSGVEIFGDGPGLSILQGDDGAIYVLKADSGSATPANNITGVYIHDLSIRGTASTEGFSEHLHTLNLNGVTDFVIERCAIENFRGDGVIIGSATTTAFPTPAERHNYNVTIRDNVFDGYNNANRNGISIIDGSHILVENNKFYRVSKTDFTMPGPIDIEPDANAYHKINDITIRGNFIDESCRGLLGGMGIVLPRTVAPFTGFTEPARDIRFENNTIIGGIGLTLQAYQSDSDHVHNITVSGNIIDGKETAGSIGLSLYAGNGVLVSNNTVKNTDSSILLGYTDNADQVLRNATIIGNRFERLSDPAGTSGVNSVALFRTVNLVIKNNTFTDCANTIFYGSANGTTTGLHVIGNTFTDDNTRTTNIGVLDPAHTLDISLARYESNSDDGNCGSFAIGYYKTHYFQVTRAAVMPVDTATESPVVYDTEAWDLSNAMTTSVFTAPTNGIYHFDFVGQFESSADGQYAWAALYIGGVLNEYGPVVASPYTGDISVTLNTTLVLTAGQEIYVYVYHTFGSTINMINIKFSGWRVEQ